MERVLDLTLKMADEGLSAEELSELERLIEAEPLARRKHVQMLELEAALRCTRYASATTLLTSPSSSLTDERRVAAVLDTIRRPNRLFSWKRGSRTRTAVVLGTAMAAAAALVLVIARPGRPHTPGAGSASAFGRISAARSARHEQTGGPRRGWSTAVLPVQAARPADHVDLDLGDSATLEVHGRAILGIERAGAALDERAGTRVTLDEGTVVYRRAGTGAATAISTPQADVQVSSGRTVVIASADETRVHVIDGQASVLSRGAANATAVAAHQGAVVSGSGKVTVNALPSALLIRGTLNSKTPPEFLDSVLIHRLEKLGFTVEAVDEKHVRVEQLGGRSLVIISPSVTALMHTRVGELGLPTLGTPILCSRPHLYQDLGMTGPGKSNAEFASQRRFIDIHDPEHPLAAGLHGSVGVLDAIMSLGWGIPAPGATRVAMMRDRPDRSALFAFERDAPMLPPASKAAARRVGFFLHPSAARFMSDEAWRLFDAAVKWAAEDAP
jgi:hypothetical protein